MDGGGRGRDEEGLHSLAPLERGAPGRKCIHQHDFPGGLYHLQSEMLSLSLGRTEEAESSLDGESGEAQRLHGMRCSNVIFPNSLTGNGE